MEAPTRRYRYESYRRACVTSQASLGYDWGTKAEHDSKAVVITIATVVEMQMRKFCYETGSRKQRAAALRGEGQELVRRGFKCIGEVDLELAEWLDWTPSEANDGELATPSH